MKRSGNSFKLNQRVVGDDSTSYFIADIGSNHDGDLERAKDLIYIAAEAGAHAAKFQHYTAESMISDKGFKNLGSSSSHQSAWKKSVYEVYKDASINLDWTPILAETCVKANVDFFTSPYSKELVDLVDPFVPAHKVGSGDITWLEILEHIAKKKKPVFLATGASTLDEVVAAVESVQKYEERICVMQCNTNYTGSAENFKHVHLNVLKVFREMFPYVVLGFSDHTPGYSAVLGSVALGARVIEKHFTDDNNRQGPDHPFAINPKVWREMVDRTRELEFALGGGVKKVENNEKDTVVVQRRSIRLAQDLKSGERLTKDIMIPLRPCPRDAVPVSWLETLEGRALQVNLKAGDYLKWSDI